MNDLFSFSIGSLPLHEGNHTPKLFDDFGFPVPSDKRLEKILNIKVLHEKCGKSGIQSKGNSYSECFTCPGVSYASPHFFSIKKFVFTNTLSFIVFSCYAVAQNECVQLCRTTCESHAPVSRFPFTVDVSG